MERPTCSPGDLVYIKLPNSFGRAIEEVTHSAVSHVGIVASDPAGQPTVIHALGTVMEEPLESYLARGHEHYAIARYPFAAPEDRDSFIAAGRALLGLPYDYDFSMTNDAIYCSELVYRAFADGLGIVPVALHPLEFGTPGTHARHVLDRLTHGHAKDGIPGVSPGDYFSASIFKLVVEHLVDSPAEAAATAA